MKDNTTKIVVISSLVILGLLCCVCLATGGATALFYRALQAVTIEPFQPAAISTSTPPTTYNHLPLEPGAVQMLELLNASHPAIKDPYDLARRLQHADVVPTTLPGSSALLELGSEKDFWVCNADTHISTRVTAVLRYAGKHLYFWVEQGVDYRLADLKNLVEAFDDKIYPTDQAYFGSEWNPGVDDDAHLYLLYVTGLGRHLAGYYSSADELNPAVEKYSNACDMFLVNADTVNLGGKYVYSTMAHEFQHMIQWNHDRSEETWLNEGFSVLAEFINGYFVPGFDYQYSLNTDLQLTDWSDASGVNDPHYGASFLFTNYLLDRFGRKVIQHLEASPQHGMQSIDRVLAADRVTDPLTGKTITANDVFGDWAVANILQDPQVSDGRYAYSNYPESPQAVITEEVKTCPSGDQARSVHQFGVDTIRITCPGKLTLNFQGTAEVSLLPAGAFSGAYSLWSNRADAGDATLTHSFDFTHTQAPIILDYHTWYDLEEDFDFVYLEASEDGKNWKIIPTPTCVDTNISGSSYGCGYNASSGGWIDEKVDLSAYAGKNIQLRFEYITDASITGEGFMLDDISIQAVNYLSDFEKDDGGWQALDFLRIQNHLPQVYRLSLILKGDHTTVETVNLDADQKTSISIDLENGVTEAILVISGITPYTRQLASYHFSVGK